MATITLTPVIIHYTVTPDDGVLVRIRTYAGTVAVEEKTVPVPEAQIGKVGWTEEDLKTVLAPAYEGIIWGAEAAAEALRADIKAQLI